MRLSDWRWPAALLGALLFAAAAADGPGAPDAVIEGAVVELNEKLDGRKDEFAEDKDALYALINDILDLSKIETGKMSLHCENFDPAEIIHQACHILKVE